MLSVWLPAAFRNTQSKNELNHFSGTLHPLEPCNIHIQSKFFGIPGSSKDSMLQQSQSTIKPLLFSEGSRQEKGFPSNCLEWLVLPWLCHARAALHCRLLPAARLPRPCFPALCARVFLHVFLCVQPTPPKPLELFMKRALSALTARFSQI